MKTSKTKQSLLVSLLTELQIPFIAIGVFLIIVIAIIQLSFLISGDC